MWKISSETFRKTNKSKNPAVFHKVRQKSGVENFVEKNSTFAFSVFNTVLQNKNCRICRTLTGKADFSTVSTASTTSTAKKILYSFMDCIGGDGKERGTSKPFPARGTESRTNFVGAIHESPAPTTAQTGRRGRRPLPVGKESVQTVGATIDPAVSKPSPKGEA